MSQQPPQPPEISVVIALQNERDTLREMHDEMVAVLESTQRPYEIIYVDDGSTDGSDEVLRELFEEDEHVGVVRFARSFGIELANTAGLHHVRGSKAIVIDPDVQVAVRHIPAFLKKLDEGADIAYADSRNIPLPIYRRLGRLVSRRLLEWTTGIKMPDYVAGIIALDQRLIRQVNQFNEKKRSLDSLVFYLSYGRQATVPVTPREGTPRPHRFTMWYHVRAVLSMIVSHSTKPLQTALWAGAIVIGIALGIAAFWAYRLITVGWDAAVLPLVVALVVALSGIQLLAIGIVGEYVGRIYGEVRERPLYTIAEIYQRHSAPAVTAARDSAQTFGEE